MRFPWSVLVAWVVLLAVIGLRELGVIDATTQFVVNVLVVGYGLGRVHAATYEVREDRRRAVVVLSELVDRMGSTLASDELDDDERAAIQDMRAGMLHTLASMDRPPWHRRVLSKLRR
jgi:hypothetical protein